MNAYRSLIILSLFGLTLSTAFADVPIRGTVAGAGLDQRVRSGARVVLVGDGWSEAGRIDRFSWTQVSGPRVRLRNANHSTADFTAPEVTTPTVLKFRLTVRNTRGETGSSVVAVTVEARNQRSAENTPAD